MPPEQSSLPTIRVERIEWRGDSAGLVWYEITYPDDRGNSYMLHPFALGRAKVEGFANSWDWDGNRDAPTLSPSYVCEDKTYGVRVHLFLRAGKIELCADSTVRLA